MVLGSGLGVLLIVGLIMLAAGLFNGSPIPLPGWPDLVHGEAGNPVSTPAVTGPGGSTPDTLPDPPTTAAPTPATTTHGNGQGTSHRPTKTPGKP